MDRAALSISWDRSQVESTLVLGTVIVLLWFLADALGGCFPDRKGMHSFWPLCQLLQSRNCADCESESFVIYVLGTCCIPQKF